MVSVHIWEPRYHDGVVLVAAFRLKKNEPVEIIIDKEFYKGKYIASAELINRCNVEKKKTKKGKDITMVVVPLDELTKVEENE